MKLLLGTHAFHLHLLDFDPATAALKRLASIKLKEQPSFALRHPTLKDLWYVTAWVDSVIFVVRIDAEKETFEVLSEAQSGGGGPTFFTMTDDGESLLIANVSDLVRSETATKRITVSLRRGDSAGLESDDGVVYLRRSCHRRYSCVAILHSGKGTLHAT